MDENPGGRRLPDTWRAVSVEILVGAGLTEAEADGFLRRRGLTYVSARIVEEARAWKGSGGDGRPGGRPERRP